MAIAFAKLKMVKRSEGKNACLKSAYNSRERIYFEGNKVLPAYTYDWTHKEKPVYSVVLLPDGADKKFLDKELLWNAVERKETKINSQVAMDFVIALPDDEAISDEDRKEMVEGFIKEHFISKGLIAQIDIHPQEDGKNWHAHILITTRRLTENGKEFGEKARDLNPDFAKGRLIDGKHWGKLWSDFQNFFFKSKGMSLRVDFNGVVSQIHLCPVRMRGEAYDLILENDARIEENLIQSKDPKNILEVLTRYQSTFNKDDVERFFSKYILKEDLKNIKDLFWSNKSLVQLHDPNSGKPLHLFTSKEVYDEERKIFRIADKLHDRNTFSFDPTKETHSLTKEQNKAFNSILNKGNLSCLEGIAGTGKSHILVALKDHFEKKGFVVRGMGPDNATVNVLKGKGFTDPLNIHKFLFNNYYRHGIVKKGKEVWIIDESGKIGNRALLELLKEAEKNKVKVVFSGDSAQLPSVERGGMFKIFCEKYGSDALKDVQRQREEEQKAVTRNLACGEVGSAIDSLVKMGSFKWVDTRVSAMEELVSHWARDLDKDKKESSLMIAHTNMDVKILNDLAHCVRQSKGEISEKEFLCETTFGKVYLSKGDKIEFRKNDKDLKVSNGTSGYLISAKEDEFIVSVKESDKNTRLITFNPKEYHSYQLGYATTFHKSQGETVDRAYVLYTPHMNSQMFYVGLTRHIKEAKVYLAKSEVKNIASLKHQISRSAEEFTTVSHISKDCIEAERDRKLEEEASKTLMNSKSFQDKAAGYTYSLWSSIKKKVKDVAQNYTDTTHNSDFYKFKEGQIEKVVKVEEVKESKEPKEVVLDTERVVNQVSLGKEKKVNEAQEKLICRYYQATEKAIELQKKHDVESSSFNFKQWQVQCGERNKLANELYKSVENTTLKEHISGNNFKILQDRSLRFEESEARFLESKARSKENLELGLKDNIENLLFRLFPDGPTNKSGNNFRFGSKGSLSVFISGEKKGLFNDFENDEKGGLLKLVEKELGLDWKQAKDWSREFLGGSQNILAPKIFSIKKESNKEPVDWISKNPDPKHPAPSFEKIAKGDLLNKYKEEVRYSYKDKDGNVLFYNLRLVNKSNPSEKLILPLSYGNWKNNPNYSCWALKRTTSNAKLSLYNLQHLKEDPTSRVLIVEGEKAADAAKKMFPEYSVMTWMGGSGSVSKTNWSELAGKQVCIWPDNDTFGFKAAKDVCTELRKVGAKSIKQVSESDLSDFPKKWDLADKLPENIEKKDIKGMILTAESQHVSILKLIDPNCTAQEKLRSEGILWRIEERLGSDSSKVKEEFFNIVKTQENIKETLKKDHGLQGPLNDAVAFQVDIYKACHGRDPQKFEIENIKKCVQDISKSRLSDVSNINLNSAFLEKVLADKLDKGNIESISKSNQSSLIKDSQNQLDSFKESQKSIEAARSLQKEINRTQVEVSL